MGAPSHFAFDVLLFTEPIVAADSPVWHVGFICFGLRWPFGRGSSRETRQAFMLPDRSSCNT